MSVGEKWRLTEGRGLGLCGAQSEESSLMMSPEGSKPVPENWQQLIPPRPPETFPGLETMFGELPSLPDLPHLASAWAPLTSPHK